MIKKNYAFFFLFFALLISSNATMANDACNNDVTFDSLEQSRRIRDQHLIVLHPSTENIPEELLTNYLNQFFLELCKMPLDHREVIRRHQVEIHLLVGSLAQHELIQGLNQRGVRPRAHSNNWDRLPGVGGTAGRNDPGGAAPALFNLASLYANHGSKNLVLHELAHTFDYFLNKRGSHRNLVSSQRAFQNLTQITPWEAIYLTSPKQELKEIPPPPVLDLSPFANAAPSVREVYERQARRSYELALQRRQNLIEHNRVIQENNRIIERNDRHHMVYHQQNAEEHFAELYAQWFAGDESRNNLQRLFPELDDYMSNL